MVGQQIGVTQVPADLHIEEKSEAPMPGDLIEQPGDPFGVLVIGRHPGTHQSVGRGQSFKDIDVHPTLGEQFVGRVHRGRPGPDDGHVNGRRRARTSGAGITGPASTSAAALRSRGVPDKTTR